jgi:hypothetical protein
MPEGRRFYKKRWSSREDDVEISLEGTGHEAVD